MQDGDENTQAAATETESQSTENGAGTAVAPAADHGIADPEKTDNPPADAVEGAGADPAKDETSASTAPAATTTEPEVAAAAPPEPVAATPEPAQGDPGDETSKPPLRVAENMANVKIVVDGQTAQHSFYPNSTKLGDTLREPLRRQLGLELDALAATGPVTISVDGVAVTLDDNSLDLGVHDGSEIVVNFS